MGALSLRPASPNPKNKEKIRENEKVTEYEVSKRFHELWETAYPEWQDSERLTDTYLEIVRCITCESSEKEIEKILKNIGPEYKLSAADVKRALVESD